MSPNPELLRCWAEIDLAAISANAQAIRTQVSGAALMGVVKANAYGHGVPDVVRALAGNVASFGVANLTEAREVRAALPSSTTGPAMPIVLLGAVLPAEREPVVREGFIPIVSSLSEAAEFARHGAVRLHLAIDTGMGRMGIAPPAALETARAIHRLPGVELAGICSHLPVADEDDTFTQAQLDHFARLADEIRRACSPALLVHVENSAGAIGFPAAAGDFVRAGLALYGVSPRSEFQARLVPALTWKTRVILVRDLEAGRSVSYGRTFIAKAPTRVATLSAGYADGYPRQVSGRGAQVLIRGRRCPVLGRVTMDQIMVDVTPVPGVDPGDEAVLLGRQSTEEISAVTLANWAGTIAWHIFTGIGQRVVRVPIQ